MTKDAKKWAASLLRVAKRQAGLLWNVGTIRRWVAMDEAAHSILAMDRAGLTPEAARLLEEVQNRIMLFREVSEEME